MEDVAAGQPEFAFEVERRQRGHADDAVAEVRRGGGDSVDDAVGGGGALVVPAPPLRQPVRELLREQAGDVHPRRGEGRVDRRRDRHLDDRRARPAVRAGVGVGAVHIVEARRDDDAAAVVLAVAGERGKVGECAKRDVHPEAARAVARARDPAAEGGGQVGGVDEPFEQQLRRDVGDDDPRRDLLARHEPDAGRATVARQHPRNRGVERNLDAAAFARRRHRLRDRPHPADRVSPCALDAVDLAEDVVEQDVRRARRVGARVVADDRVEAERRLDQLALEPAVEELPRALGEQREDVALRLDPQPRRAAPLCGEAEQRADPAARVRRGLEREVAQHIGDGFERSVIGRQRSGVGGREAREFRLRLRQPAADLEIAAPRQRQEVGEVARDHPIAVRGEVHVGDDLRAEQADGVARDRIAEAGGELLGHRRAADDPARLDDADLEPRAGEVEGGNETVVAAADDDGIEHKVP